MTVPRIYSPRLSGDDGHVELGKETLHYVKSVLRMKKGDSLMLFDGKGWECETVIKQVLKNNIIVETRKTLSPRDREIFITLMQSLPKANKMDFIVHKATELGVCRIVPFLSSRSIPRLSLEKGRMKTARWHGVAVQAARQCSGADIPEITDILSFEEALSWPGNGVLKIILWEEETGKGIKQLLCDTRHDGVRDIAVIVGPEGGFSQEEVARAMDAGFISVSLGRQVLKVDTAVLTILSIIQYEKGMFRGAERKESQ